MLHTKYNDLSIMNVSCKIHSSDFYRRLLGYLYDHLAKPRQWFEQGSPEIFMKFLTVIRLNCLKFIIVVRLN